MSFYFLVGEFTGISACHKKSQQKNYKTNKKSTDLEHVLVGVERMTKKSTKKKEETQSLTSF